jgi:hypothetical protein
MLSLKLVDVSSQCRTIADQQFIHHVQVSNEPFLDVSSKFKDSKGRQAKLKAPAELEAFPDAVSKVCSPKIPLFVIKKAPLRSFLAVSGLICQHIRLDTA